MKKNIIILISFFTMSIVDGQNYMPYYKNLKNIIRINDCSADEFKNNKNNNIRCLDANLNTTINNYFNKINPIKYDSINPGRLNHFLAICEIKYSQTGKFMDFKISDYTGFDQELVDQYKEKASKILHTLPQTIQNTYTEVLPAIDFDNKPVESIIPLAISIKIVNKDILLQYRHFSDEYNLLDYNAYSNDKELKSFYDLLYNKIEKTFDKNFKSIALKNNIKRCYAHLYFEVTANGKIQNIKNIQQGDKIFEKYLKDQFLKTIDKIKAEVVAAKLIDGTKTNKTYLMSFQYGFKK